MREQFLLFLILGLCATFALTDDDENFSDSDSASRRDGKLFPIFQVVKFKNSACSGGSGKNGTCYTAAECSSRGGSTSGDCASGYGVCCIFSGGCGSTFSENCTYFESASNVAAGDCRFKICKASSSIAQIRLDFQTFVITGPSTDSVSGSLATAGVVTGAGKSVSATASQCVTDLFSVTNPGGVTPRPICGTNTDTHMYVDASDACNELNFQLGSSATGTTLASNRRWSIKITQYDMSYSNLAPEGCTQYHFGDSTTGTIKSYNYDGGQHLADQKQTICIRRERGKCRICYSASSDDFMLSGKTSKSSAFISSCCSYGTKGTKTSGYDCLEIPGAAKKTGTTLTKGHDRFCGRLLGTAKGKTAATVCSNQYPFKVTFISDTYEFAASKDEAIKADTGFKLTYYQVAGDCS